MDDKDNGRKMGEGTQGWNSAEGGSAKENGAMSHENGSEGASNAKMDIDSLAGGKAHGEALDGLRMENGKNVKHSGNMNGWDKDVKPKKNTKVIIGVVVLVVVVLAAIGVAIWMGNQERQENVDKTPGTSEEKPDEDEEPEPEKPTEAELEAKRLADAQAMVDKMEAALKKYLVTDDGTELFEFKAENEKLSVLYRAADMEVAIPLVKARGFIGDSVKEANYGEPLHDAVWEKINSGEFLGTVESVFTENGFVKTGEDWTPLGEYVNWETGVICTNIGGGMPIYFSCGHISWLDAEEVALANELAEAYLVKQGNPLGSVSARVADIENSPVAPYQRLNANIYGARGLFYRVSPEANWQFFMGTQAPLGCSDFNTEDLKKAYAGEVCYEEDGEESVVEP